MSAAAAPTVNAGAAVPAKKGKKKLIIIAVAVLLVLLIAGAGAALFLKKRAADQAAENGEETSAPAESHASAKPDLKHPPTFLPLDPFVVNLADKDADRYAQVGITIEVVDAKFADQMKLFMPAIRNGILMILAHKDSKELLDRNGKEQLAAEILRDASRTMGIEVEAPEPVAAKKVEGEVEDDEVPTPKKKKAKKKADAEPNPIKHVHFSNFIVQ
ncbi:MAG: flagellar basal body-associated FliL family protein [Pseudomonadota bacterium]|jgi:flagellar FliL protein